MLNCAVIMGRLVADPELRQTAGGIPVTRIRVAGDRNYQKQGEERKTDFIDVTAWRQNAEFITKYFHKGSMIAIQGSIQTGSYTDKDGNKRNTFEILADRANFCGSKNDSGAGGFASKTPSGEPDAASFSNGNADDFAAMTGDDDLPF